MLPALSATDVTISHPGQPPLLDGFTLQVDHGESVALSGPSGVGKTTLLRALAGMHPLDAGTLTWMGRPITGHGFTIPRRDRTLVSYLPQNAAAGFNPRRTLAWSLQEPARIHSTPVPDRDALVAAVDSVGVTPDVLDRRPKQCSGGQLQRCAWVRATLNGPRIVLLDEPTTMLDDHTADHLLEAISVYRDTHRASIVIATHDPRITTGWDGSTLHLS